MMEGMPRRRTSTSLASGNTIRACEPVVLAITLMPFSRRIDAMILVTLDLPRVPVTAMRNGMATPPPIQHQALADKIEHKKNQASGQWQQVHAG